MSDPEHTLIETAQRLLNQLGPYGPTFEPSHRRELQRAIDTARAAAEGEAPINTPAGAAPELSAEDSAYLTKNFVYHPPIDEAQLDRYATIRAQAHSLARAILLTCPPSRDRSLALTNLETAMFWANASIARSGK